MHQMHWSWAQLVDTPEYVRQNALHHLGLIGEHQQRELAQAKAEAERRRGG